VTAPSPALSLEQFAARLYNTLREAYSGIWVPWADLNDGDRGRWVLVALAAAKYNPPVTASPPLDRDADHQEMVKRAYLAFEGEMYDKSAAASQLVLASATLHAGRMRALELVLNSLRTRTGLHHSLVEVGFATPNVALDGLVIRWGVNFDGLAEMVSDIMRAGWFVDVYGPEARPVCVGPHEPTPRKLFCRVCGIDWRRVATGKGGD
jgi:hypothetical protein